MFRAVLEGLAFEARTIADTMVSVGRLTQFEKIITIGSSSENQLLSQIKADVYGLPIHVNPVREAVSLGAALTAGVGSGTFRSPSAAIQTARREEIIVEPNPKRSKGFQAPFDVYRDLYGQLRPAHHRLRAEGA
jgi:sugar (pentulose or hexulose) kinase